MNPPSRAAPLAPTRLALRRAAWPLWRDPYLYAVLLLSWIALFASYQFRLPFFIDIGGQIDRPLLVWVHDPQFDPGLNLRYRWTTGGTEIVLPGWGRGSPVELRLRVTRWMPDNHISDLTVYVNGLPFAEPAASGQGWQEYSLPVTDPQFLASDDLRIKLETDTFVPKTDIPGATDPRRLGVQLDSVGLVPLEPAGGGWRAATGLAFSPFRLPPTEFTLSLVASALVLYLTLVAFRRPRAAAFVVSTGFSIAVAIGLVLARPYVALFGSTFFSILLGGVAAALVARWLAPRLFAWGGVRAPELDLDLLSLLFALAVVVKLSFLLYPQTISYDLLYHIHRLEDVLRGTLFWSIPSGKNEFGGQPVPYLPSYYLFLAPFAGTVPLRLLVQLSGVLLDSVTIFFLYYLAKKYLASRRAGLFAAWIYILVPLALIAISWGIYANLFGQFLTLVLAVVLVDQVDRMNRPRAWLVVTLLFALTFLSHTSVLVSVIPFFGLWVAFLFIAGRGWRSRPLWLLVGSILVAAAVAFAVYYSEFVGLVAQGTQQIAESAGEGATGSAAGEALTFWQLLQPARTEFTAVHPYLYACALAGLLLLSYRAWRARARGPFLVVALLVAWILAFFLLAWVRAEFGFSTRYVNFAMPAIALCAGAAWAWLWDAGDRLWSRGVPRVDIGGSLVHLPLYTRLAVLALMLVLAGQGAYHWFVLAMFKYH